MLCPALPSGSGGLLWHSKGVWLPLYPKRAHICQRQRGAAYLLHERKRQSQQQWRSSDHCPSTPSWGPLNILTWWKAVNTRISWIIHSAQFLSYTQVTYIDLFHKLCRNVKHMEVDQHNKIILLWALQLWNSIPQQRNFITETVSV